MVNLQELIDAPRKTVASYGEVLPWFGMVADGLVLCNDGSLLAGYEFDGIDIQSVTDEEINRRIDLIRNAFRQFSERITIWTYMERREGSSYEYSEFYDPVAALIDAEWGSRAEESRGGRIRTTLYIGYSYPSKAEAFFDDLKNELDEAGSPISALKNIIQKRVGSKSEIAKIRGRIAAMAEEFEGTLKGFYSLIADQMRIRRLVGANLLGDLYSKANLASHPGPVAVPAHLVYLNTVIPSDDVVRQGDALQFRGTAGTRYASVLSVTGMPSESTSVHIDQTIALPAEFIVCQSFKFIERTAAEAAIQKAEQFYRLEVKSVLVRLFEQITKIESDKVNTGYLYLAEDAQSALVDLTANEQVFGYYSMNVVVLGNTTKEVDRAVDTVATRFRNSGYAITRERQGLFSGFLGSLPGNIKTQMRQYMATISNVSDLFPGRTLSDGERTHPHFSKVYKRPVPPMVRFQTPYGVPLDFNLHADDLGHAVVIGGSGSGKTSLVQLLVAQFQRYHPANTFIFDKDRSMALLSVLMGGRHIDMGDPKAGAVRINPVMRMLRDGEVTALTRWLSILMSDELHSITPEETEKVADAVQKLNTMGEGNWRLGMVYTLIKGVDRELARRLAPYVDRSDESGSGASMGKGPFADYFDNEDDNFDVSSIMCLETGRLLATPEISAPFMDYAFYCIERSLDGRTPTLIYVEEAWFMLSNPTFEDKINDWLRTFRKKCAFVVFATQSPSELKALKSWAAFVSNVPTFIFLRSIKDSIEQTAPLYRSLFNLNDDQLALISAAVPKRDYLMVKPGLTRLVTAQMPPLLLAINDATGKSGMVEAAAELARDGRSGWQIEFIKDYLGIDYSSLM